MALNVSAGSIVYSSMRLLSRLALRIAGVTAACLLLAHGNLILFVSLVALITFLFFAYVTIRLVPF